MSKKPKDPYNVNFLQAWIRETCRDMSNFMTPKVVQGVSLRLGIKLADFYKNKLDITNWKTALPFMFQYMGAKGTEIEVIDEKKLKIKDVERTIGTYTVTVTYSTSYCPIGGRPKEGRDEIVPHCLCEPYVKGLVSYLDGLTGEHMASDKIGLDMEECILGTSKNYCKFRIRLSA